MKNSKTAQTRVSTSAPWFLPGGQIIGLRSDMLEVLRAMEGRSPREIFSEHKPQADSDAPASQFAWTKTDDDCDKITAVIPLSGPITQYTGVCDWMFGGTSLESFMASMEDAFCDDSVTSIVIDVDSPGGEVNGIADAADRIRLMSATKPIVAFTRGNGCSAAYWLECAASEIIASQTAVIGSIGIVMTYVDDSEAEKAAGIRTFEFVSSVAPKKRMDPGSEAGKADIQALVNQYGDIFVAAVAKFRGVTTDKVEADFGQGGVLMGASAVSAGLADRIGTLEDAILAAQKLAGPASSSTTGTLPKGAPQLTTTRATAEGGLMNLTAQQILAEHPAAAAEIAASAALKERARIQGILKINTAANRAVASAQIDAALADGNSTAGDLAMVILEAQGNKLKAIASARAEDGGIEVEDPEVPPEGVKPTGKAPTIDTNAVYARMNGASAQGAK